MLMEISLILAMRILRDLGLLFDMDVKSVICLRQEESRLKPLRRNYLIISDLSNEANIEVIVKKLII